jgi:hypothetical protein
MAGGDQGRNAVGFRFQVGGKSTSGTLPGWRPFNLNEIDVVTVRDERFEIDDEFEVRARDYRRGIV